MKSIFFFLFVLTSLGVNGQFFDFNFFKPSTSISAQHVVKNPTDSISIGLNDYQVSGLFPLRKKFDVDLDWGNVLKSKGLLDAFKKVVNPKFSQLFGRVGLGYRTYDSELFRTPVDVYNFSAGITGMKLQMRSGKFRFFMYSLNVRLQEQLNRYKTVSPSFSGLFGAAKIFDYRSGFFYGMYANYYAKRFIPAPILAFYYRLDKQSDFLLVFPYQIKYNLKLDNVHQGFAVSLNSFTNGVFNDSLLPNDRAERLNFSTNNLRFSSQTRFELGKKAFFYLEAGWQDVNSYNLFEGYTIEKAEQLKGNLFVKGTLRMVFGKSMFNSSVFDIDL